MDVTLVDSMGSDQSIVDAARVSFAKRAEQYSDSQNHKLIRYLAQHDHWSPFSHSFLSFHIKAPLFVARQLVKHQVGLSWNEVSRRYVDDTPEFYQPAQWRARADNVKQGSSGDTCEGSDAMCEWVEHHNNRCLSLYNLLMKEGAAPEQARMVLPTSLYTEWYWSGSLYAFHRICSLRCKPEAQQETRSVALMIDRVCAKRFPVAWQELAGVRG